MNQTRTRSAQSRPLERRFPLRRMAREVRRIFPHGPMLVPALAASCALFCWEPPVEAAQPNPLLPAGTLPQLRGTAASLAGKATFVSKNTPSGAALTITQLLPQLVLSWNQFNIAQGSVVKFIQPSSTAAVLNRIYDANPSVIQGQLQANGQVFLVNQNGFLFDRGAQINVNTLYASSLDVADAVFQSGVENTSGAPSFAGTYGSGPSASSDRSITVGAPGNPGAAAPQVTSGVGGAIVIIAPIIKNQSGIITSPDGQVILAAGSSAYLSFDLVDGNSMRGLLVQVTAPSNESVNVSSLIQNSGTISAPRGNVTLAGLAINQDGHVSASSAMLENGSIWLQSSTQGDAQRGTITFGPASVTETPLDTGDTTTLPASESYTPFQSVIKVTGAKIVNQGSITSPGGSITFDARDPTGQTQGQVYLDAGSVVSAAGAWSDAPYSDNLLTFKVTSNELANSPDQKGGLLEGSTVTVDLRTGSSILDLSAYQANLPQNIAEKAFQGGTVTLNSSGAIIERAGALLDVSGGGIQYSSGVDRTTKLLASNGEIYDIGSAPEGLIYTAILGSFTASHPRWGYSQSWTDLLYGSSTHEPGYVQGGGGGTLILNPGAGLVLDGTLKGGTTVGPRQQSDAPVAGTLQIGALNGAVQTQDFGIGDVTFSNTKPEALDAAFTANSALPQADLANLTLSTQLFAPGVQNNAENAYVTNGFGNLTVYANGTIAVPATVDLFGPVAGSVTLAANAVDIAGKIGAPAGTIAASTLATVGTADSSNLHPGITISPGAELLARGLWVNDFIDATPSVLPSAYAVAGQTSPVSTANGGTITLTSRAITVGAGSLIDVSAGGTLSAKGKTSVGSGGAITIAANPGVLADYSLNLSGTLLGYGATKGGSLTITARSVSIGEDAAANPELALSPAVFQTGGFQNVSISAADDLTVVAGTEVNPVQANLVVSSPAVYHLRTGGDLDAAVPVVTLPQAQRSPSNITLASLGGTLTVQKGAALTTDPGASVTLQAATGLTIDGAVTAPGGTIKVALAGPGGTATSPVLDLGEEGILNASGTFVATPNNLGQPEGTLWAAGSVSLSSKQAVLDLEAGSLIDVDGATHPIALANPSGSGPSYITTQAASNAGAIAISANDSVTLDGVLTGRASGNAAGGSFAFTSVGRGDLGDLSSARRLVVSASGAQVPALADTKDSSIEIAPLEAGGFDKLSLQSENQILFAGSVNVNFARGASIDSELINLAPASHVLITGADVTLANSFGQRQFSSDGTSGSPLQNGLPSLAQPTAPGSGVLVAQGQTIDIYGSVTLGGVASTALDATGDVRLSGRPLGSPSASNGVGSLTGSLTSAANLTIAAAQVYPTTGSTFTLAVADGLTGTTIPGGAITIASSGHKPGAVYSAGGTLTIQADNITQDGIVRAPLGTLSLEAGTTIALGPQSTTSVSAAGLTIPFGETNAGIDWTYAPFGDAPDFSNTLAAPPAKVLNLQAPTVNVQKGAVVDVSGGGNIVASEWVSGPGGTSDALIAPNTYAIIPSARLDQMPIDPDLVLTGRNTLGFSAASNVYNGLSIGSGGLVPAGTYALLPGYYALLPGAYLVQVVPGATYSTLEAGHTAQTQNGLTVVPGSYAVMGTQEQSYQTVGVIVRPGSDAQKLASYTVTNASYFATLAKQNGAAAPALPIDAGRLEIAATQSLTLDGTLDAAVPSAQAKGAQVDIASQDIAIVDAVGQAGIPAGYLDVDASSLSNLNASISIGALRSSGAQGTNLLPVAANIIVANSAADPVTAPELILAATGSIDLKGGSALASTARGTSNSQPLDISGANGTSGALVRLSNGGLVDVVRPANPDSTQGTVTIEAGATLSTVNSLIVDATQTSSSQGTLNIAPHGALALSSGQVSLGQVPAGSAAPTGLVLANAQLAAFDGLGTLQIKSYGGIDLFGSVAAGGPALAALTIDASSLTGMPGAQGQPASATLQAQTVTLLNSGAAPGAGASQGTGTFTVNANQIVLGAGSKLISGYAAVDLSARGEITAASSGVLETASDLDLSAARIGSQSGANQQWLAQSQAAGGATVNYDVNIATTAAPLALGTSSSLGSRLEIDANTIADDGAIVMNGGAVTLNAAGSIALGSQASIAASGLTKTFLNVASVADAGSVTLSAPSGAIAVSPGALIDVSAAAGGNAGTINLTAASLALGGAIRGQAASGLGGSIAIDLGTAGDVSGLYTQIATGGFTDSVALRLRSGDLTVASTDAIRARSIALSSDTGTLLVEGLLDASGAQGGGAIELDAASIHLGAGATLSAAASSTATSASTSTPALANGGSVTVNAESGSLQFDAGALIDVRGAPSTNAGQVVLRAPRTVNNDGIDASLEGTILAPGPLGQVTLEGNRIYAATGTIAASDIATYAADNAAFMAAVNPAVLTGALAGGANVQIRPAVEVRSSGDLAIDTPWDLTQPGWITGEPGSGAPAAGTLTVRAAGDLAVNATIGNPTTAVVPGPTWNINLVAGADLSAANPLKTQSLAALAAQAQSGTAGAGDFTLGGTSITQAATISTGTGNINIAAGHDFVIQSFAGPSPGSVLGGTVYTDGEPAAGTSDAFNRYLQGGGNISITAQHDAIGASNEWVTDWFRVPSQAVLTNGAWWTYLPAFFDGIGAFGGGNIAIAAGHDVNNLSAMLPTSATLGTAGQASTLAVFGGGNLSVSAGNNIVGGEYMVALGAGVLKAQGSVGTSAAATQLYLMGVSGTGADAADVRVTAGGDIVLQDIVDPTTLPLTHSNGRRGQPSFPGGAGAAFFTYSTNSEVDLSATGGNIVLGSVPAPDVPISAIDAGSIQSFETSSPAFYPARVSATAFSGSISTSGGEGAILYPSAEGMLKLYAQGSIAHANFTVSDAGDAAAVPTVSNPTAGSVDAQTSLITNSISPDRIVANTSTDTFIDDIVALNGSITDSIFYLPARSRVWADTGISGTTLSLQNLGASDLSEVVVDQGSFVGTEGGTEVRGPGRFLLEAGQDVDLNNGNVSDLGGLVATGNLNNPGIATGTSAELTVVAGVSGPIALADLNQAFSEIVQAGETKDSPLALAAVRALFPGAIFTGGSINAYLTSIQTYQGSGIDLFAPAGNITVGLSSSQGQEIGVITNAGGAIRSYLSGNFDINAGKVITGQGGDIIIYTSEGSIDAGRGAKTSLTTPPPQRVPVFDANGDVIGFQDVLSAGVAGSGIQTVTSKPDGPASIAPPAGSVFLFAPQGTINAGEAGIESGANLFISAQTILNADNITAAGTSVGVPQVAVGSIAASLAASGATSGAGAAKAADDAAADAAKAAAAANSAFTPSVLSVDVLGFGDKQCRETDRECLERK